MNPSFDFEALGLDVEYLDQRCQALWRCCREARAALVETLARLGIDNPRKATDDRRSGLLYALYNIEGDFEGIDDVALAATARIAGERIAGAGGHERDARTLADRWFPAAYRHAVTASFRAVGR